MKYSILFRYILFICLIDSVQIVANPVQSSSDKSSHFILNFTHRTRYVNWDNAIDLDKSNDDQNSFTRHRTSISSFWHPSTSLELGLKLTNEFRYYFKPENRKFNLHEIIVDQLYLKSFRPSGLPFSFVLGRQNMMFGEGFVVMDGHPLDGSRSIYFNALRMDFLLNTMTKLTFFYMYQPVTDAWLPVINDQDHVLIEQPEEGYGFYFSFKIKNSNFDAYLIQKNIKETDTLPIGSNITTAGGRFMITLISKLSLTGETAFQSGSFGENKRLGFGGYFHLDYQLKETPILPNKITWGGIQLSGDDPDTDRMEAWDPLFSRWPKWSESYIYTLIPENNGKVAYWSNLASIYGSVSFRFLSNLNLLLMYHHLTAPFSLSDGNGFPGGTGKNRGNLFIVKLNFHLLKSLSGHILWEKFTPGNFYRADADRFNWFRVEFLYKI